MSKSEKHEKKRGIFLTILLIFIVINVLEGVFNLTNINIYKRLYDPIPIWLPGIFSLGDILEAIGVYGILKWKKWGVYSLVASIILSFLAAFFVLPAKVITIFGDILLISGLLYWAISRKWKYFS